MITALSKRISIMLLSDGYLTAAEEEEFVYGLFTILSRLLYLTICTIVGILMKCFVESVVFYLSFIISKKYSGGFHASSEIRCFFLSTLSIFFSILCICFGKVSVSAQRSILILAIISGATILIFAPIESNELQIEQAMKKTFKLFSAVRIVILIIACGILFLLSNNNLCISICMGINLEGIFVVIGFLKRNKKITKYIN